ncbi:MAG TPA: hypothetical protein ACFCUD_01650 [Cyclobacteriaceae bacterium]
MSDNAHSGLSIPPGVRVLYWRFVKHTPTALETNRSFVVVMIQRWIQIGKHPMMLYPGHNYFLMGNKIPGFAILNNELSETI